MSTNKKDRLAEIEKTRLLAKLYSFLNRYIEFPKLNIPKFHGDVIDIESLSMETRNFWGLGNEPITNMINLLEKNGLILTSFSTKQHSIDAFSQRQVINGAERYFVVLGNDNKCAVRRQFSASHELAHILLHDWSYDIEQISRSEFRHIESQANEFASAFLLPKEAFLSDLVYPIKLDYYVELKKKWKVSISSMIIRAHKLKVINYNQYQYLMRQISKNGWRANEPLDDILDVPQPKMLKKAIDLMTENNILTEREILSQLSKDNLSLHRREVEILLGLDEGRLTIKEDNQKAPIVNLKMRKY